jgi:hypothetical protein
MICYSKKHTKKREQVSKTPFEFLSDDMSRKKQQQQEKEPTPTHTTNHLSNKHSLAYINLSITPSLT